MAKKIREANERVSYNGMSHPESKEIEMEIESRKK